MRILLAITGASGIIYGRRLLEHLNKTDHEVSTIISQGAKKVAKEEDENLPESTYDEKNLGAPPASGSNAPDALIICPCSLKTLGEIANGVGSNLISRTAEVCLKERKKLILVVRETPYSLITIKNMEKITLAGGIILPATPGFYHKPKTIEQLVDFICGKVFDQLNIDADLFERWGED